MAGLRSKTTRTVSGSGENFAGKTLMKVRSEFAEKSNISEPFQVPTLEIPPDLHGETEGSKEVTTREVASGEGGEVKEVREGAKVTETTVNNA